MLTESTLDYFDCLADSSGTYYMRGDPAMECWNYGANPNLHTQLLPLALFALLAYPFGIMFLFVTIFWRHRVVLKQQTRQGGIHIKH